MAIVIKKVGLSRMLKPVFVFKKYFLQDDYKTSREMTASPLVNVIIFPLEL